MVKCEVGDILYFEDKDTRWWEFVGEVINKDNIEFKLRVIKYIKSGVPNSPIVEKFNYTIDNRYKVTNLGKNKELVEVLYG